MCPTILPRNAPLVVVLHGCTQTAAGYDHAAGWSRLADREGFVVLYPQQRRANNANLCFNWFVPGDISRDGGEAQSIRQMIEAAVRRPRHRPRPHLRHRPVGRRRHGRRHARRLSRNLCRRRHHRRPALRHRRVRARRPSTACADTARPTPRRCRSAWPRPPAIPAAGRASRSGRAAPTRRSLPPTPGSSSTSGRACTALPASRRARKTVDGHRRMVWVDGAGQEAIEYYLIQGMSHGTPLDTADGLSHAAPYMIDAGISSTLHIAGFFGLVDKVKARTAARPRKATPHRRRRAPPAGRQGRARKPPGGPSLKPRLRASATSSRMRCARQAC